MDISKKPFLLRNSVYSSFRYSFSPEAFIISRPFALIRLR